MGRRLNDRILMADKVDRYLYDNIYVKKPSIRNELYLVHFIYWVDILQFRFIVLCYLIKC